MIKKIVSVSVFFLMLLISVGVFAQAAKDKNKEQEVVKKEEPKATGPEKLMIYDGANIKLQFYGYVKLDVVYNSRNVQNESAPFLVEPRKIFDTGLTNYVFSGNAGSADYRTMLAYFPVVYGKTKAMNNGSLVADPRHTRFGFKLMGPMALGAKTSAVIEADFWGMTVASGTGIRQGQLRMRHANVRMDWTSEYYKAYLLMGQFWSIAMADPQAQPNMVTFIPLGKTGLLFMREPQITLGQTLGTKAISLRLETSAARVMGGDDPGATSVTYNGNNAILQVVNNLYPGANNTQVDSIGRGEASKKPGFRGRVALESSPIDDLSLTLGGTTQYQIEKHEIPQAVLLSNVPMTGMSKKVDSFVWQVYTNITYSFASIIGAYWRGKNLDTFLSGLDQGVVWERGMSFAIANPYGGNFSTVMGTPYTGYVYRVYTIKTHAVYGQLVLDFNRVKMLPLSFGGGFGQETKTNAHYVAAGKILWNKQIFGNMWYYANDYLKFGFEVTAMQTKYKKDLGVAKNMKYQFATQFTF